MNESEPSVLSLDEVPFGEERGPTIFFGRSLLIKLAQIGLVAAFLLAWHWLTAWDILPSFIFGKPVGVAVQIWKWFYSGSIWIDLWTTLVETVLSFIAGTALGMVFGLWLGLSPIAAEILDPFFKAINSMPRIVFGPIFAVCFGLGITSKVALGITTVFFVVFFNVFQGVREVNIMILANTRMLGANRRQLLSMVYIPSAMTWVFSSLHNAVGMAFVGAVIGEYLGSARGVGYLILQAEGVFNMNGIFAGIIILTFFAFILDRLVTMCERRLLVWQPKPQD